MCDCDPLEVGLFCPRFFSINATVFQHVPSSSLGDVDQRQTQEDLPRCAAAAVLLWWKCANVVFQKCTEAFTCQRKIGTPKLPCNGEGRKSRMETGGTKRQNARGFVDCAVGMGWFGWVVEEKHEVMMILLFQLLPLEHQRAPAFKALQVKVNGSSTV